MSADLGDTAPVPSDTVDLLSAALTMYTAAELERIAVYIHDTVKDPAEIPAVLAEIAAHRSLHPLAVRMFPAYATASKRMSEAAFDVGSMVEEGVHTCACGSKRTMSTQVQTRSADEGATNFVKCVACKRMWRQNN